MQPLILESEIRAQAPLWRQTLDRYEELEALADSFIQRAGETIRLRLLGVGEGSSFHALRLAFTFWQRWGLPSVLSYTALRPWELSQALAEHPPLVSGPSFLYLPVSQSGRTRSIQDAWSELAKAAKQGALTYSAPGLFLTNNPEPSVAMAQQMFCLNAGQENAIAATKTMTTSVLAILLLGLAFAQLYGTRSMEQIHSARLAYKRMANTVESWLDSLFEDRQCFASWINPVAESISGSTDFHPVLIVLSAGRLTYALPEMALKLKETTRQPVLYYHTENFKHGPVAMLSGSPVHPKPPCVLYVLPVCHEQGRQVFSDAEAHFSLFSEAGHTPQQPRPKRIWMRFANSLPLPGSLCDKEPCLTLPEAHSPEEETFFALLGIQLICMAVSQQLAVTSEGLQKAVE